MNWNNLKCTSSFPITDNDIISKICNYSSFVPSSIKLYPSTFLHGLLRVTVTTIQLNVTVIGLNTWNGAVRLSYHFYTIRAIFLVRYLPDLIKSLLKWNARRLSMAPYARTISYSLFLSLSLSLSRCLVLSLMAQTGTSPYLLTSETDDGNAFEHDLAARRSQRSRKQALAVASIFTEFRDSAKAAFYRSGFSSTAFFDATSLNFVISLLHITTNNCFPPASRGYSLTIKVTARVKFHLNACNARTL